MYVPLTGAPSMISYLATCSFSVYTLGAEWMERNDGHFSSYTCISGITTGAVHVLSVAVHVCNEYVLYMMEVGVLCMLYIIIYALLCIHIVA